MLRLWCQAAYFTALPSLPVSTPPAPFMPTAAASGVPLPFEESPAPWLTSTRWAKYSKLHALWWQRDMLNGTISKFCYILVCPFVCISVCVYRVGQYHKFDGVPLSAYCVYISPAMGAKHKTTITIYGPIYEGGRVVSMYGVTRAPLWLTLGSEVLSDC